MAHTSTCLTPRETQVLALIAHGCREDDVAERLTISPHTVHNYTRFIRLKLGATNIVHAVFLAITLSDTVPYSIGENGTTMS